MHQNIKSVVAAALAFSASSVFANNWYIGPNGNDGNFGNVADAPLKTLNNAWLGKYRFSNGDNFYFLSGTNTCIDLTAYASDGVLNFNIIGLGTKENPTVIDGANLQACATFSQYKVLNFSNITFVNGSASAGGALNFEPWKGAQFGVISNCVFKNCTATGQGGAVSVPQGTCKFVDCTFETCKGTRGGAVAADTSASAGSFVNCTFVNCEATKESGGAVYTDSNATTFERCAFTGNKASASGKSAGAVRTSVKAPTFTDCAFTNNMAATAGAVSAQGAPGTVTFARCSFVGNEATTGEAGAVAYDISGGETVTFGAVYEDCLFKDNKAATVAGAIRGLVQLATNTTFVGNSANTKGAVWYLNGYASQTYAGRYSLENTFVDCTFSGNTTPTGLFASEWNKKLRFDGCCFTNNTATGKGLLYTGNNIIDFAFTYENCMIVDNRQASGSMVLATCIQSQSGYTAVGPVFRNTTFKGNDTGAGSLYSAAESFPAFFESCTFADNIGAWTIYLSGGSARTVRNCLFADNTATNATGGGIGLEWQTAKKIKFEANTVVNNKAAVAPYGVWTDSWCWEAGSQSYSNNLFYCNRGLNGETGSQVPLMINAYAANCWFEKGASTIGSGTRGNVVGAKPGFVKAEQQEAFGVSPYSLRRGSPARGRGAILSWMDEDAKDLAGNPRLRDGKADMGCFQCWLDPFGSLYILR